jgi:hypothetical protein
MNTCQIMHVLHDLRERLRNLRNAHPRVTRTRASMRCTT